MRDTSTRPRLTAVGVTLAVGSAVCFGSAGPATKALTASGLSALEITQARMSVAAVLLLAFVGLTAPRRLVVRRAEWPLVVAFGVLAFCVNQSLYAVAVGRLPVGVALLLEYLSPVMVVLWVRFVRGTRLPGAVWLGVGAALVGLVLVGEVWAGFRLDLLGVLAGVGTAVALTARFLLSERGLRTRDPAALAALGTAIGAVALDVVSPVTSFPFAALGGEAVVAGARIPLWGLLCWLAVVSTVLAYLTGVSAQRYLPPTAASQLATLEVVVAGGFAALLLGERLSAAQVLGGAVILVGVLAAQVAVAGEARKLSN
ncbi:DMT family transporter [Umezawaea endophytica]|uniref:DMT family transporter n=1 Tax=Umezawaea endophytica TaxID=1654476 RepID=A0A9X2VHT0_9PSEU|nr:DMT family transporter [Umezawaea endophytica]MCS7476816.1 DMT family transporter [Umezawaea endophytica]